METRNSIKSWYQYLPDNIIPYIDFSNLSGIPQYCLNSGNRDPKMAGSLTNIPLWTLACRKAPMKSSCLTLMQKGAAWAKKSLEHKKKQLETRYLWAYKYTQGTHQVSSRKPRGDPAENPAEHPGGTWRPSGPQGPDIRHQALCSQPCTASADAGGAIRTLVLVTSLPRPPPERANLPTYDSWGKSRL